MKTFLGIDLGSTTTKAVFLAMDGRVLGHGLTNTRANFETACAVARSEALADARFALFESAMATSMSAAEAARYRDRCRTLYEQAQRRERLSRLRWKADHARPGESVPDRALHGGVASLVDLMAAEHTHSEYSAEALLSEASKHATAIGSRMGWPYERLITMFDRMLMSDEAESGMAPPEAALDAVASESGNASVAAAAHQARFESIDVIAQSGTGYGRHRLPFEKDEIRSEILCHGLGAHHVFPETRTVLDIGGQDTKAIQLDERGLVTSFQMNDRCAAGCGRYLGYVADELSIGLSELGPMAMTSSCPSRINSTCTVFAGAEIRERLGVGEKREDVVAGLHRAIVQRAMSLLSRSGGVRPQLTFSGGVARNPAAVKFLTNALATSYGAVALNVSPNSIFNGALGAALFARMEAQPC